MASVQPPNEAGGMWQIARTLLPWLMQAFTPAGYQVGQFFPTQSHARFQENLQFFTQQLSEQQGLAKLAGQDVTSFFGGVAGTLEAPWGEPQKAAVQQLYGGIRPAMPILARMFPDFANVVGPNFSALGLLQGVSEAGRYNMNAQQWGAATAGVTENLWGGGKTPAGMFGYRPANVGSWLNPAIQAGMGPSGLSAGALTSWALGMAQMMSAAEDVFGWGLLVSQQFNMLQAATMGGRGSPADLSAMLRKTGQLSRMSGIGMQQLMGLQAGAAAIVMRGGGDIRTGVSAQQHAAALATAIGERNIGGSGFTFAGINRAALVQQDARLVAQAANSPVYGQLAATLRIGDEIGFASGSEAAALHAALQQGQSTYDWGGRQKSTWVEDTEWNQMMASGGVRGAAGLRDQSRNAYYGYKYGSELVARELQWDLDIGPRISAHMMQSLGGGITNISGRRAAKVSEAVAAGMRNFDFSVAGEGEEESNQRWLEMIRSTLIEQGIPERRASRVASRLAGAADEAVRGIGYRGAAHAALINEPTAMAAARAVGARAEQRGEAEAGSPRRGAGLSAPIQRVMDALRNAESLLEAFIGAEPVPGGAAAEPAAPVQPPAGDQANVEPHERPIPVVVVGGNVQATVEGAVAGMGPTQNTSYVAHLA